MRLRVGIDFRRACVSLCVCVCMFVREYKWHGKRRTRHQAPGSTFTFGIWLLTFSMKFPSLPGWRREVSPVTRQLLFDNTWAKHLFPADLFVSCERCKCIVSPSYPSYRYKFASHIVTHSLKCCFALHLMCNNPLVWQCHRFKCCSSCVLVCRNA